MKSRWLIVLLVVSVAINFALAGYLLGRSSDRPGFDPTRGYVFWARSLPEDRRAELAPLIRKDLRAKRPNTRALRRQHRQVNEILRAEVFDKEALSAALAKLREGHHQGQAASHEAFVSFVEQLSLTERQALAEDLSRPRMRNPRAARQPM